MWGWSGGIEATGALTRRRRFVVGHGVAKTTGALRVGAVLDLDGLGPLFNGKYYLAEVRHRFDAGRGLRSEFSAERAGLGRRR